MLKVYKRNFDLPAFVDALIASNSGRLTLTETVTEIDHEIAEVERSLSRDSHMRFQQMRYINSLGRLVQFLRSSTLPTDLTPRERLAICTLSDYIGNQPEALVAGFHQVTLPKGIFGQSFELAHRLAS